MRIGKFGALVVALLATATMLAPPSSARMKMGNYDVLTNRYDRASWFWYVKACIPEKSADCIDVGGRPRLKFYAYYESKAWLVDGRYTFTVDQPDGLRCPGYNMPTRDTYSWDATTLFGTIDSKFDVGCFNGPPGTQFWTFALQRL
ncbi:hypothetical protein ACQI4F_04845 [Mycolicibacterium vaccae]|uniref:hypothetical protein n=1 Tax=Mycolicibacterium vaccae TaxID=1810 RepID=UPI003CFA129B